MGRPTDFSDDLALGICELLAEGESLRQICERDGMPGRSTVLGWLAGKPDFVVRYARARELQADHLAEDILVIADAAEGDVQRDRLRVDARKWLMSKLAPKKYGDRITHAGETGSPLIIQISSDDARL